METVWLGLGGAGVESPLASYVFLGVVTAIASAVRDWASRVTTWPL